MTEQADKPSLKQFLVRRRWWFFGGLVVLYALTFTGQWRVGRDSALYRGLGHTLAIGKGFTFSTFGRQQIYPGLPVMLAGLERTFGSTAVPALLIMQACAVGCLITTYKLVSLRFPKWVAVAVTFCMGVNGWFLQLSNEILTDIPFLFGMLLALYGWERLRAGSSPPPRDENGDDEPAPTRQRHWWKSLVILLVGLALAASMRPTFWILAGCWMAICIWGLIVGPRRGFYALCLGVLLTVWIAAMLLDPRVKGFNPLGGGYERDAVNALDSEHLIAGITRHAVEMIRREFAFAFFGQLWFPPLTEILTVVAIGASLLLWRINPLWTILVLATIATTIVMNAVPRYYIMVLPLLLIAWIMLWQRLARFVPPRWSDAVLLAGLLGVACMGFARCCKVIGEQHHLNRSEEDEGPKWKAVLEMGDVIRERVPQDGKVIGPAATIMAYASDRTVLMQRDLWPENLPPTQIPAHLQKLGIEYAVFPPVFYRKGDRVIRDLMERGVIVPVERVGRTQEMVLAKIRIENPPRDWRERPMADVMTAKGMRMVATATRPATMQYKKPPTTAQVRRAAKARRQAQIARIQRQEKEKRQMVAARRKMQEKKRKHTAATQRAARLATQPATTQPSTPPPLEHPPPATQPSTRPPRTRRRS